MIYYNPHITGQYFIPYTTQPTRFLFVAHLGLTSPCCREKSPFGSAWLGIQSTRSDPSGSPSPPLAAALEAWIFLQLSVGDGVKKEIL